MTALAEEDDFDLDAALAEACFDEGRRAFIADNLDDPMTGPLLDALWRELTRLRQMADDFDARATVDSDSAVCRDLWTAAVGARGAAHHLAETIGLIEIARARENPR